jgi:tetratricopeptide (TPR) repeat protein
MASLSPSEEAQLAQTIEMFEVITQSQPHDYQSLEILKEAYSKLNREKDVVTTSKRIAQAYVQMGQLSSAILEYETILQRYPDDPDVQAALQQIESKANNFPAEAAAPTDTVLVAQAPAAAKKAPPVSTKVAPSDLEDGRRPMQKLFVETKVITAGDFDLCWSSPDPNAPPGGVIEPFIQILADKGILAVDKSLKMLCDKSRAAFIPLKSYDIDMDLARTFPAATCQRWCVLPFDRMSKSILVATTNPFNQQAAKELAAATSNRLLWYLVPPAELVANVRKAFH